MSDNSSDDGSSGRRGLFAKLAHASELIKSTAAGASEVLVDKDLRRRAGSKLVTTLQGGIQEIGTRADAVRRNVIQNVGVSLTHGRKGAQGVLERVQTQLHQQRLKRALTQTRGQHVDIQIGFNVYLDVPQEMRSRLWLVILQEPSLAVPFQELGRFPDLGSFDMESVPAYGSPSHQPSSSERQADGSIHSGASLSQTHAASSKPEMVPFVTQPKLSPTKAPDETSPDTESGAIGDDGTTVAEERKEDEEAGGKSLAHSNEDNIAHLSDADSDEVRPANQGNMVASSAMIRGGESLSSTVTGDGQAAGKKRGSEGEWEVVDKSETLADSSYVGPATFADCVASQPASPAPGANTAAEGQPLGEATGAGDTQKKTQPVGRKLDDANRRRLESQEATALKMRVSEDRIKTAIIAVKWPVVETVESGEKYRTLLQVTVGQEEVEDVIRRDIHRTFPQHPQFLLGQGQEELFNLLKAYSLTDMPVGYCQGMGFLAGILLMYMPEHLAFQLFSTLMSSNGPNLRRLYLDGMSDLKHEMAKFEWLLARHHPKLAKHLQEHCIPCVLYVSQWLLTVFACPFPAFFTAQLVDIMLLENSDRIVMQTCMAIMAEVEERILRTDNFEDIITCLKSDPAQWSDDKLRGLLTAAYLSSVSEEELKLAGESVCAADAGGFSRRTTPAPGVLDGSAHPDTPDGDELSAGGDRGDSKVGVAGKTQTAGEIDALADLMKHELEQLQWAGPSASRASLPAPMGDALDAKSLLRITADVGSSAEGDEGKMKSSQDDLQQNTEEPVASHSDEAAGTGVDSTRVSPTADPSPQLGDDEK